MTPDQKRELIAALDAYEAAASRFRATHRGTKEGDTAEERLGRAEDALKRPLELVNLSGATSPYVHAVAYHGKLYAVSLLAMRVVAIDRIVELGDD